MSALALLSPQTWGIILGVVIIATPFLFIFFRAVRRPAPCTSGWYEPVHYPEGGLPVTPGFADRWVENGKE